MVRALGQRGTYDGEAFKTAGTMVRALGQRVLTMGRPLRQQVLW